MTNGKGVAVNDTILWVRDTGEAHLPPILCLHSLFVDGTMFDAFVEAAKGRYRVVCPDFRGQGGSAPSQKGAVSMKTCAEDMNALIEKMKLPKVHIVAASMGGDVSVRMAAKRPDLFRSMVMMGSSVRSEPSDQKELFRGMLDRTRSTGFAGEDLDMLMSIMFGETSRSKAGMATKLMHWRERMGTLSDAAWDAMYGVLERSSGASVLQKIRTPSLIINGVEDIARPPEWAQEVADGIEGSQLFMMEGVGHSPILENQEVTIPKILGFIQGVDNNTQLRSSKSLLSRIF